MSSEINKCVREKYWEECDSEQQIQRLRSELSRLYRVVGDLEVTIKKLTKHQHAANGELLTLMIDKESIDPPGYQRNIPYTIRTAGERS